MRITFMLNVLNRIGGVRVVLEYANYLQKMHHEVCVVYPAVFIPQRARSNVIDHLQATGDNLVHGLWNRINKGRALPFETDASLVKIPFMHPRFAALMERFIPDADVIIATAWETAYTVNKFSKRTGEKFYLIQSYEIWDVWNNVKCWDEAGRIRKGDNTLALAMADVIPTQKSLKRAKELVDGSFKLPLRKITIADWLKRLIKEKFGECVEGVIPNGVNLNIFFKERDRPEEVECVNILMPYRPPLFKGFKDGLEAFKLIKARHPDTYFAVFGPPIKKELQNLPEWVEFHNIKSDAQLRALYNDAHIFVLPSWIEGFPLPPMEAMACGCALVTTDAGGVLDYLEDGKTALVVPIRDPAALARSVCKLIEDAHERRRIAENGYRLIRQFTWERAAKELEALLQTAE
jgi:glycosyltransferase involved in cell wall biosynthesis